MRDKRGISAIVATVLIILITVAAITIVWAAIIPMIRTNLDFSSLQGRVSILSSGGYTAYDADRNVAIVQVKREVDEGVMDRIKIVFSVDGNSYSGSVVAPESGGTKVYNFNIGDIGVPDSVSVAPIFAVGNKEREGDITSTVDIPSSSISEVKGAKYEVGRDYFEEIPMSGLVSWWQFNGNAEDSVGGNDGIITSADFIDDSERGKVVDFDGNNGWGKATLIKSNSITMSVWLNLEGWKELDANRVPHHIYPNGDGFVIATDTDKWRAWIRISDVRKNIYSDFHNTLNEWHHIVLSYDENSGDQNFYVDGEQVNSKNLGAGSVIDWGSSSELRFSLNGYNTFGKMDDVMIYNRALSEEEIAAIYDFQKN